jgi:hypothetical protein
LIFGYRRPNATRLEPKEAQWRGALKRRIMSTPGARIENRNGWRKPPPLPSNLDGLVGAPKCEAEGGQSQKRYRTLTNTF